jgi:hypothetical protein
MSKWFDEHVMVIGMDDESNEKIKSALRDKVEAKRVEAVDNAIAASRPKIGKGEAKATHALLKGRH